LDGETTIIPAEVLKANFSLERISSSPAVFDFEKLEWMNGVYIRDMKPEQFAAKMFPWIVKAGLAAEDDLETRRDWYVELAPLVKDRTKRMTDVAPMVEYLFIETLEIDPAAAAKVLTAENAGHILTVASDALAPLEPWEAGYIEDALRLIPDALGTKPKSVFQVIRVAITGSLVSLPLFESIALLGRERTLARLEAAQAVTEQMRPATP